jgi:peptide subunit release factor 1 (eRF1)
MNVKFLTKELIGELASVTEVPCISLYMPTHRSHPENAQDIIRYKNLYKKVKELVSEKFYSVEIATLLEPYEALADNRDFWNHTTDGLAVLCSPGFFEVINLPIHVDELTIVADTFHTKPLRRCLQSADRYQVLGLNQHEFKLFEGNRHALVEVILSQDIPTTIEEALGHELTEKHLTVAAYGGTGGESSNMHHGHGGKKDEIDIDADRFFRFVANVVHEQYSKKNGLPLILAALPEHHNRFKLVNENPLVLPTGIVINPHGVSTEKLAQLAWEVMHPVYLQKLDDWIGKFNQAKAKGLGSDIIDDVIEAAEAGRVDTLFIEAHRIIAKRLRNKTTGVFESLDTTQPTLDDLLDDIGELVSKMGGSVLIIPQDKMPSKTGLAAIFRY